MNNKQEALHYAIEAKSGNSYDDEGRAIVDPNKVVEAAKKFEAYLKETTNV